MSVGWLIRFPLGFRAAVLTGSSYGAADRKTLDEVLAFGVPTVCLGEENPPGVTAVINDDTICAQIAADHLLERNFRCFGYVGMRGLIWSDARRDRFVEAVERAGMACDVLEASARTSRSAPWYQRRERLTQWIDSLPKPVGIMACYDAAARTILDVCRDLELLVPEQVAIIGVDNDEVLCDLSDPPLSSVAPDTETIGMEAARRLDAMMDDPSHSQRGEIVIVPPCGIVTRRSTDTEAITDPLVAGVVGYIRLHACDGLDVAELLKQFPISRRTLERRFLKLLGRSPLELIRGERMKRVKALLCETDLKLDSIASMTGYGYTAYMVAQFREAEGMTPGQFRKQSRSEKIGNDQS